MANEFYDVTLETWPDLKEGRVILMPVRVGMDRRTGKMLIGYDHVIQSIQTMFATRFHERVLRRWVGTFIPHLLGEVGTTRVIARFYWAIATSLDLWEPNYRIQYVNAHLRSDGTSLTSSEELRLGKLTVQMKGIHRPRGHLGDTTPESRRAVGLRGESLTVWDRI